MKQDSIANAFTGLLTVCALIVVTLVVRREFFPPQTPSVATSYPQPRVLTEWRDLASVGHVIGSPKARLKIVEFSDFQCPFCNDLHLTLKLLLARHPGEIAVVYRHFPLPARMHPFAQAAAIASECAAAQHKFVEYHDALFERQDSIGTISWERFAQIAGVPDTARFRLCRGEAWAADRVSKDLDAAKRLSIAGTPTIIMRDRLISAALPLDTLEQWIRRFAPTAPAAR